MLVGDQREDPHVAVRIGELYAIGRGAMPIDLVHATLGAIEQLLAKLCVQGTEGLCAKDRLEF